MQFFRPAEDGRSEGVIEAAESQARNHKCANAELSQRRGSPQPIVSELCQNVTGVRGSDLIQVNAALNEPRGERMAQVMKPKIWDARPIASLTEFSDQESHF
jgi:hypothetical protein